MSTAPPPDDLASDARWLVQALDPAANMVRLIAMSPQSYRAASFLDDRMMQQRVEAKIVPWRSVESLVPQMARRDARWIFHIGHVGSTLVARLLGEISGVLAIREPRFLRDITTVRLPDRKAFTNAAAALYSRTFAPDEVALVKATSFTSELASDLVPAGERALFMYASPRNYMASILAGENSVRELRTLAPLRLHRLNTRITQPDVARNDAERAALAWACEMTSLVAAADAMHDRQVEWLDFDQMLGSIEPELGRLAGFFGFATDPPQLQAIVLGPLMSRYSKAPEYEYSAKLRRDLIAEALAANRKAIDDALAMLRSAAEKSPILERALSRAGEH
jgi:hypothetical protein